MLVADWGEENVQKESSIAASLFADLKLGYFWSSRGCLRQFLTVLLFRMFRCGRYVSWGWFEQKEKVKHKCLALTVRDLLWELGRGFGDKQMFLATWRNGRVCPPEDKNAAGQPNTLMGKSANGARGRKFHRKKLFDCRPNGERNLQSMTSTGENSH